MVADLEGVGQNLQDHLDCYTVYDCNGPHSYYGVDQYAKQAWWGMQYLLFRNGPVTTNIVEAGAFVKADPASEIPDTQLHFLPAYVVDHGMMRIRGYGVCLYTNLLRPKSRGTVRLASADPDQAPADRPELPQRSRRPAYGCRRSAFCAAGHVVAIDEAVPCARADAGVGQSIRHGPCVLYPGMGEDRLPSRWHLQDGQPMRSRSLIPSFASRGLKGCASAIRPSCRLRSAPTRMRRQS